MQLKSGPPAARFRRIPGSHLVKSTIEWRNSGTNAPVLSASVSDHGHLVV